MNEWMSVKEELMFKAQNCIEIKLSNEQYTNNQIIAEKVADSRKIIIAKKNFTIYL